MSKSVLKREAIQRNTFDYKYKEFQVLVATSKDKKLIIEQSVELNKLWLEYVEGSGGDGMKQYISVEQLKQFDMAKLDKTMNNTIFSTNLERISMAENNGEIEFLQRSLVRQVTIGKLIEILNNTNYHIWVQQSFDTIAEYRIGWMVELQILEVDHMREYQFESVELIDALWKTVLYVMEEESK